MAPFLFLLSAIPSSDADPRGRRPDGGLSEAGDVFPTRKLSCIPGAWHGVFVSVRPGAGIILAIWRTAAQKHATAALRHCDIRVSCKERHKESVVSLHCHAAISDTDELLRQPVGGVVAESVA